MMLTRFHKILIGLLAVQLALAVVMLTRSDDTGARKAQPLLAGFDAAKVTKVEVVAKADGKPIDLARQGTSWVVASSFDYPVRDTKVNDLLASLAKAAADAPIATQASRHKQLHVDDGEFERKLVLTLDGKPLTIYIGTSAGARRTAVRLGGDARVYAVSGLDAWSIGDKPRDWVDTRYLEVKKDDIQKLTIDHDGSSLELERDGDHWKAALAGKPIELAKGETLDTAAIDRIVDAAAAIDLSSPADPKRDASKPTATLTITRKAAASTPAPVIVDLIADGSSYWVHDRASPRAVLADKSRLDDVVGAARDKLVKKPEPAAAPAKPQAAKQPSAPKAHAG
ncbi:MAG: DUF4340 domain-containing protein [Acidobacteriota bacterium]